MVWRRKGNGMASPRWWGGGWGLPKKGLEFLALSKVVLRTTWRAVAAAGVVAAVWEPATVFAQTAGGNGGTATVDGAVTKPMSVVSRGERMMRIVAVLESIERERRFLRAAAALDAYAAHVALTAVNGGKVPMPERIGGGGVKAPSGVETWWIASMACAGRDCVAVLRVGGAAAAALPGSVIRAASGVSARVLTVGAGQVRLRVAGNGGDDKGGGGSGGGKDEVVVLKVGGTSETETGGGRGGRG